VVAEVKAAHPGEAVEAWCEDEARFGLQPVRRRVWAPKGERPVATVAPDYEWLWMYAAAHPATGESFWLSLPRLDGEMTQLFLDEFAKACAPAGKQIILSWDGAPAHRAGNLRVPERIRLVRLPPYTPEVNPTETLWPLVKEGVANDSCKDLGALERRVCRRVRRLAEDRELISSRLNYHWWPSG
jgi:transposase